MRATMPSFFISVNHQNLKYMPSGSHIDIIKNIYENKNQGMKNIGAVTTAKIEGSQDHSCG